MSMYAASTLSVLSFSSVLRIDSNGCPLASVMRLSSSSSVSPKPSAFSRIVTGCLRLRSTRTYAMSFLSTSNSSHAPRPGMILASMISFSGFVLSA
jgi:hypothetical protein